MERKGEERIIQTVCSFKSKKESERKVGEKIVQAYVLLHVKRKEK